MSVVIPSTEKTGAAALAAKIVALAAIPTTSPAWSQSQQLLAQRQADLVETLLDQRKLNAASILSTVSYVASKNPLAAAITKQTTLVSSYGATAPAAAASQALDTLQRQAVLEMMISGAMPASLILSTMSYVGGAAV